ncbi:amino acid ABC transporter ATP-binding protein, partial [Bacteroides mediterraneensis]
VSPGEVVAVIGPSGGGKSTLLRCLTLLERLDAGNLSYGELVVARDGSYGEKRTLAEARSRFGLVFQNYNLFPHFTVLRNVMDAPVCVQRRDRNEVEGEARALLAKMGLAGCEDKVPCQLSGGQQQRVAIARALSLRPDVIIADEPTSALDVSVRAQILNLLTDLKHELGLAMVFISHDIQTERYISDRIVVMNHGQIMEEG